MIRRAGAALLAALFAPPALACETLAHEGQSYVVCRAEAGEDVRLFLNGPDGKVLGTFPQVDALLAQEGRKLGFAMNAGMYHPDRRPVGLYVEEGEEVSPLVENARGGNFGLQPNGVFCIGREFAVIETAAFAAAPPACRYATQSGPMLVIDGALHPRFLPNSTSRYIRNGVGVSADGQVAWFAISEAPVTFHEFGSFFRDALGVPQALYFDGSISRLYAPGDGRLGLGLPVGPIVGRVDAAG